MPQGLELVYWAHTAQGALRLQFPGQEAVYFIARGAGPGVGAVPGLVRRRELELQGLDRKPVDGLYFRRQWDLSLESRLEIEFETHFIRFLMPTIRGAATASKKRYAGSVRSADGGTEPVFKGLESGRSDWTPLARDFQRELYRRIFFDEPWRDFVLDTVERLKAGGLDEPLVYRKRLRQSLDAYRRNVPPHVQAARKLTDPGRWISYLITRNGPEPQGHRTGPIDYQHYLDRQLAPVADGILHILGESFAAVNASQMDLF